MVSEATQRIINGCNGSSYIENNYLFDNRLSPTEKTVYATLFAICHNSKHPEYCYPRQDTLSQLINLSVRTIQRALKKLVEFNYIKIKHRGSISNLYYITAKIGKQVVQKVKDTVEHARKACKANKTDAKGYNKKESTFNDYNQRNYNFDKLEDLLLKHKKGDYKDCLLE